MLQMCFVQHWAGWCAVCVLAGCGQLQRVLCKVDMLWLACFHIFVFPGTRLTSVPYVGMASLLRTTRWQWSLVMDKHTIRGAMLARWGRITFLLQEIMIIHMFRDAPRVLEEKKLLMDWKEYSVALVNCNLNNQTLLTQIKRKIIVREKLFVCLKIFASILLLAS